MRPTILFVVLLPMLVASVATADDIDELAAWMTGSFSSAAQAAADSNYYDIRLEMAPIWTGRTDGQWIYVEQAVGTHLERPYRQRVYHVLEIAPGLYESAVYALPGDPLDYAGQWREDAPLADIGPDDLVPRQGCGVLLRRDGMGAFSGGTVGRGCGSSLRGAAYATSEVIVTADRLTSWDRGFDAEGNHVWGAELGPYIFVKQD